MQGHEELCVLLVLQQQLLLLSAVTMQTHLLHFQDDLALCQHHLSSCAAAATADPATAC